jgi:hypothetical protein
MKLLAGKNPYSERLKRRITPDQSPHIAVYDVASRPKHHCQWNTDARSSEMLAEQKIQLVEHGGIQVAL